MPPDPAATLSTTPGVVDQAGEGTDEQPHWYDRSPLPGNFMVMIDGQTEADHLRRAPDHQFCEFIDGIVYMPPRAQPYQQEDVNFLVVLIRCFHSVRPIGYLATGPAAFKLRNDCWLEPDLFIAPEAARTQVRAERFGRPPVLLVVEVLAPSNRNHDLVTRSAQYHAAQVDEVWYIDRPNRAVIVERLEGDDYTTERVGDGPIAARSPNGFWFDAGWLWQLPEPNVLDCVQTILAGPPPA